MALNQTGLFIVRAWVEAGSSKPLRIHIRQTTDIGVGFQREITFADVDAVCAELQTWLNDVLAANSAA